MCCVVYEGVVVEEGREQVGQTRERPCKEHQEPAAKPVTRASVISLHLVLHDVFSARFACRWLWCTKCAVVVLALLLLRAKLRVSLSSPSYFYHRTAKHRVHHAIIIFFIKSTTTTHTD